MTATTVATGPQLFPRIIATRDELGYPLLAHDCPFCGALALILNEWDAIECLTCSWREFGPDSPRAVDASPPCPECEDTGMVWSDACTCGSGREFPHERYCGAEPCPNECPVNPKARAS